MAQHDYILNNQSGAAFRSDLNNALAAIVSQNSGTAEPTTTYAYMMWADTTNGKLKLRNGANNAWIELGDLASAGLGILNAVPLGTVSAPGIAFTGDPNTGIYSPGADQLALTVGGVQRLNVTTAALLPTLPMRGADGTAANPAYSFSADTDTGLYRVTANTLSLVTNGADRFVAGPSGQLGIAGTNYGTAGQVLVSGGASAAPSWAAAPSAGPSFSAYPQVALSLSANTETKVVLPNERFDTANCYDTANSKFTPNVAGYYWVMGLVSTGSGSWGANPQLVSIIKKNGSNIMVGQVVVNSQWTSSTVSQLVYMNGTTDYLELYAQASSAVGIVQYGAYTEFSAFLARAA